ncbi:MAG: DNA repair protein RadC [Chloroflexi bacterium]|nr:DNA repair protein RadC [Chloroflexota bacterium]
MSESERPAYRTIREWAGDERPRERLLEHGPGVLSDAELIAIVLRSGMPGENVVDMARGLLESVGGLSGLVRADPKVIQRSRGLGPAKAAQVAAAIELGRRAQQLDPADRPVLLRPDAVFRLLGPRLVGRRREEFYVLPLDTRGRLLGSISPTTGGAANSVAVRPAEAFREASIHDAVSVVIAHNHPSGDPRPSPQDIAVTKSLIAAGKLPDIEVLDHLVIGAGSYVSMQREGMAFERMGSARGMAAER